MFPCILTGASTQFVEADIVEFNFQLLPRAGAGLDKVLGALSTIPGPSMAPGAALSERSTLTMCLALLA